MLLIVGVLVVNGEKLGGRCKLVHVCACVVWCVVSRVCFGVGGVPMVVTVQYNSGRDKTRVFMHA